MHSKTKQFEEETIAYLKNKGPQSTRGIANFLYAVEMAGYRVIPGPDRMSRVRGYLYRMLKKGLIAHPSSTMWSIPPIPGNDY